MKKRFIFVLIFTALAVAGLFGQATKSAAVNGMTLNGSTGLITVPDSRVGWERADVGLDMGYGIVWSGGRRLDHLPRFALSLFQRFEISGLLHFGYDRLQNGVIGGKIQIFRNGGAALALGGDFEFANTRIYNGSSAKIYLAATYMGDFFSMPAVTTATIGWQLLNSGHFSSQFVYGMGFSMGLFPEVFRDYVCWITDFSNFSYAVHGPRVNAAYRGTFNTGLRIHPIKKGPFNLVIDIVGTDLLDESRGISAGVSGGFTF